MTKDYRDWMYKKICILHLADEPNDNYDGKTGIVTSIGFDYNGMLQLWGTWGGVAVYPDLDQIQIMEEVDI